MADLGAVGRTYDILYQVSWSGNPSWELTTNVEVDYCDTLNNSIVSNICIPTWVVSPTDPSILSVDTTGCISGYTQLNGVPFGNVTVRLYYRPTGEMIAETTSLPGPGPTTGQYTFCCLEAGSPNYYVLAIPNPPYPPGAFNPPTPPGYYNLARQDHVTAQP